MHLASALAFDGTRLRWSFTPEVQNSAQGLLREQANPALLACLQQALPGLARLAVLLEAGRAERPADRLRGDPAFQALLQATGGEVLEVREEA